MSGIYAGTSFAGRHPWPDTARLASPSLASQRVRNVDIRKVDAVLPALKEATVFSHDASETFAWRSAQSDMMERTLPIRAWLSPEGGGCPHPPVVRTQLDLDDERDSNRLNPTDPSTACGNLALHPHEWTATHEFNLGLMDEDFFNSFLERFRTDPNFFLGMVYIPLPWRSFFDAAVRHKTIKPRDMALRLLQSLDSNFWYFIVLQEASPHEFDPGYTAMWDRILSFDSRGLEPRGNGWLQPRVPIPLRYSRQFQPSAPESKTDLVFFSCGCHSQIRRLFGPGTAVPPGRLEPEGRYQWDIRACDNKMPYDQYNQTARKCNVDDHPDGKSTIKLHVV
jgi:hypothetical protein